MHTFFSAFKHECTHARTRKHVMREHARARQHAHLPMQEGISVYHSRSGIVGLQRDKCHGVCTYVHHDSALMCLCTRCPQCTRLKQRFRAYFATCTVRLRVHVFVLEIFPSMLPHFVRVVQLWRLWCQCTCMSACCFSYVRSDLIRRVLASFMAAFRF